MSTTKFERSFHLKAFHIWDPASTAQRNLDQLFVVPFLCNKKDPKIRGSLSISRTDSTKMASFNLFTLFLFSLIFASGVISDTSPGLIVTCFNCGTTVDRAIAVGAANQFCGDYWKTTIYQSDPSLSYGIVFT